MHMYRAGLMNPGPEPDDPTSADWGLWYAQMCVLGNLHDDGTPVRSIVNTLTWLGDIRAQRQGFQDPDDPKPSDWPDDSLLGVIEALFTYDKGDLSAFEMSTPSGAPIDGVLWALWCAHWSMKQALAWHGLPPMANVARAMALVKFMAGYHFPVNHPWAESETLTHSMEIWIRG